MTRRLLSLFSPLAPQRFVYMLQQVEYNPSKFVSWLLKLPDLSRVRRRQRLKLTRKVQVLLLVAYGVWLLVVVVAVWLALGHRWLEAGILIVLLPWAVTLVLILLVGIGNKLLYIVRRPLLKQARRQLQNHPAVKIAVLGSYGKTTMKELLLTVLSEVKNVKATPGNMNVPISHARWVTKRVGTDEDVLIFEYGEGEPGDISRFAKLTRPDYGVITGLAPNHLDHYPSLEAVADDLLSIRHTVADEKLLLNSDAAGLHQQALGIPTYGESGVGEWKVEKITVNYEGTGFVMKRGDTTLKLRSQLLGRHQTGPLAAAAALASELGLTAGQIEAGIAKTKPFEHRMEARQLHGAWLVDDTYNGNLEGIRAGLRLLGDLEAKRKIYVTPGLVDQGAETDRVHREIGRLIAAAAPDKVVLMQNSVTPAIQSGMETGGYKGELVIEDDPLNFYTNLEHTVAAGDLLVMQNDWTDNYT